MVKPLSIRLKGPCTILYIDQLCILKIAPVLLTIALFQPSDNTTTPPGMLKVLGSFREAIAMIRRRIVLR